MMRFGGGFHTFSTFWARNELVAGGEVSSIVIGKKSAIINFKCEIKYEEGNTIIGKFGFVVVDSSLTENGNNSLQKFAIYKFICKVSK